MSTGKSSIASRGHNGTSVRGLSGNYPSWPDLENGESLKSVQSSADFPQNSLNEDPVPIAFSDRISSTHVARKGGASRRLGEQGESNTFLLLLSDAHKRDRASLTKSCKRPRVSKREAVLPNSHLS